MMKMRSLSWAFYLTVLGALLSNTTLAAEPTLPATQTSATQANPELDAAKVAAQALTAELHRRRLELEERERLVTVREQAVKLAQDTLMTEVRQLLTEVARYEQCAGRAGQGRESAGSAPNGEAMGVPILVAAILSLPPRKAVPLLLKSEPRVVSAVVRQLGNDKTAELLKQMSAADATRLVNMINAAPPATQTPTAAPAPKSGRSSRKEKK